MPLVVKLFVGLIALGLVFDIWMMVAAGLQGGQILMLGVLMTMLIGILTRSRRVWRASQVLAGLMVGVGAVMYFASRTGTVVAIRSTVGIPIEVVLGGMAAFWLALFVLLLLPSMGKHMESGE